jgi:hypothetical protein
VAVVLELGSALSVESVLPTTASKAVGTNPATLYVPNVIPVRGSLLVIVTLKVSASAKSRDRLTVSTTAKYFTTPTRTKKSVIRVIA